MSSSNDVNFLESNQSSVDVIDDQAATSLRRNNDENSNNESPPPAVPPSSLVSSNSSSDSDAANNSNNDGNSLMSYFDIDDDDMSSAQQQQQRGSSEEAQIIIHSDNDSNNNNNKSGAASRGQQINNIITAAVSGNDHNSGTSNVAEVTMTTTEEKIIIMDSTQQQQEDVATAAISNTNIAENKEADNDENEVEVNDSELTAAASAVNQNQIAAQHDDNNNSSRAISPSTLPDATAATTNNNNNNNGNNNNDDPATLSPGTQTLVAEAERQAAIAAAISANMSSLYNSSPSVAGNIAKVMLHGQHQQHHHQQQHHGQQQEPTMVALPPLPPPPPPPLTHHHRHEQGGGRQQQRATNTTIKKKMKPVRFEDVRIAFDDIIMSKSYDNKLVNENSVDDGRKKVEGGGDVVTTDNVDNQNEEEIVETSKFETSTAEKKEEEVSTAAISSNASTTSSTTSSTLAEISTTLPDSFLRFLLLVMNVPLIIEEGEKVQLQRQEAVIGTNHPTEDDTTTTDTTTSSSQPKSLPQAAIDAARRTHELYTLIQHTYNSISQQQQQQTSTSSTMVDNIESRQQSHHYEYDATANFFAACSGEIVKVTTVEGAVDVSDELGKDGVRRHDGTVGSGGGSGGVHLPKAVGISVEHSGNSDNKRNNSYGGGGGKPPPSPPPSMIASAVSSSPSAAAAVASASAVFSNVMLKVTKKQSSFSDIGKKFLSSSGGSKVENDFNNNRGNGSGNIHQQEQHHHDHHEEIPPMEDYEVTIDQEMLGLTVENVLERTIIRTLLPNGAAIHAGAKIGSLIAKVGNVDTSNLTHFETIDELRQSQRPLKLTLRYISSDILRCAREEMGRLIRGRIGPSSSSMSLGVGGEDGMMMEGGGGGMNDSTTEQSLDESFDTVLRDRWSSSSSGGGSSRSGGSPASMLLSSSSAAAAAPAVMTRAEMIHHAGKDLIRILALLVVGMEKELLASVNEGNDNDDDDTEQLSHPVASTKQHLSSKELIEAIEITSKILLEYARGHPEVAEGRRGNTGGRLQGSSFYPVPPGRVQSKKQKGKAKKAAEQSPLLRIGDALQRTRFFLVETSSITATALRWEIIDYLCTVLDLDTEQELSEKEAASATGGGEASPTNDLGSAGSILKLIVLNCSTSEDTNNYSLGDDSSLSCDDQSTRSGHTSHAGNAFISVVHRLAASKSTSARITACSLGPVLWSHLDFPRQLQLRGVITRALHDVEVIVRKPTAAVLHEIAELVFDRRSVPWLVLMCERSMTDPEPQLRAAAMTLTWHLAEHLPNAFLGDANKGSLSIRRLPPRTDPTFMDVYLLQCKLLPVASNLAEDRIASVRLSVAAQCDRLVDAMGEHWFNIIIDLLQALLSDSDERVRSEATLCMPRFTEAVILGTDEDQESPVVESLMPLALKLQKDPSPFVRSSLATAAGELLIFLVGLGGSASYDAPGSPLRRSLSSGAPPSPRSPRKDAEEAVGYKRYKKHVDDTFIPILQNLLQDPDPEVTTASLRAVTNASRSSRHESSTSVPSCSHNKIDTGDDDLVSVASMTSLQSHLSVDRTKPVFIPVLSEKQVLRLLPTLSSLATSAQWRVRQSAVEIVPALLGCTHLHETRHEISKLCLTLMGDKVDTVRKTAAECLCLGGSNLARHGQDDGGEWISKIVIPHLRSCSQSEDAKQRMLSLKMIEVIVTNGLCPARVDTDGVGSVSFTSSSDNDPEVVTKESAIRTILAIAASLASDTVPNVRLNVGRLFAAAAGFLDRVDADFAASVLEKQIEEENNRESGGDRDVIYFAQQALSISRQQSALSELRRESSLMD